jgi:hypothetical protein
MCDMGVAGGGFGTLSIGGRGTPRGRVAASRPGYATRPALDIPNRLVSPIDVT